MNSWQLKSGTVDIQSRSYTNKQNIKLVRVSAPTISIVTLSEAKNYLKIGSDTTDDTLINSIIDASTSLVERELGGIAICQQTWKQFQKGGIETIQLLREPIIGIPTISFYDDFGTITATNVTYSTYFIVVENELFHVDGYWESGRDGDGYTITYDCGMFTPSNYLNSNNPDLDLLKVSIMRISAWLYENREEHVQQVSESNFNISYNFDLPVGIKRLLQPLHTGKGLI